MATGVIYEFLFDHNVFDHILISHSIYPLSIAVSYVLFTKYLGPSLMRNKNGLQLKNFMIGFNLFLCLLNTYLSWTGTSQLVRFFYMNCRLKESPDYNIFKEALQLYGWHIYLVKFFELFDTVIFVLRKKFSQITFLHVFHHSIVFLICWISMRIQVVGYYLLIIITVNSYVHVIMYFYYFLSAFGPRMQKYLWWKRHLTKLQMMQFVFAMVYLGQGFVTGCEHADKLEITIFALMILFFILFLNFYLRTFLKNRSAQIRSKVIDKIK